MPTLKYQVRNNERFNQYFIELKNPEIDGLKLNFLKVKQLKFVSHKSRVGTFDFYLFYFIFAFIRFFFFNLFLFFTYFFTSLLTYIVCLLGRIYNLNDFNVKVNGLSLCIN